MDSFDQHTEHKSGTISHFNNFRSKYVQARNVDVWLPEGFDPSIAYGVLYMHDGQNIFESESSFNRISWKVDQTLTALMARKTIRPCIVVGIWNTEKRFQEYTPVKPFLNYNQPEKDQVMKDILNNIISDEYLKFITEELKPFIDDTFKTLKERESTFICGSSMGGLISVYALCEYPEIFGGAACLSTHWPFSLIQNDPSMFNAITGYLKHHLPPPETHKIYFDRGTETLDSIYASYQSEVDRVVKEAGYTDKSWMTRIFEGDEHSELYWQRRFHIPATFLLTG